jgi:RHS repeat-associated protein
MDAAGAVKQVNNFYPSGTSISECPRRTDQGVQPYKYEGKELDRTNGLDFYDFEARTYNPVLMHFTRVDSMAEKYPNISPFAFLCE